MNKIFNKEDIRNTLEEFGEIGGISPRNIPIIISSKMKRTLGAFTFKWEGKKLVPISFKFSLKLLQGDYDEKIVKETIGHEYAHFLVNVRDNYNHNHDSVFKEACKLLKIPTDTLFRGEVKAEPKTGYILSCNKCNKVVGRRRRIDSAMDIKKRYKSGCCKDKIIITKTVF